MSERADYRTVHSSPVQHVRAMSERTDDDRRAVPTTRS
jgi:hypothetical protein